MAFIIPTFKSYIEDNAIDIRPDTPVSIDGIVEVDATTSVNLHKFKYHLAGRNLHIYWIFNVIFIIDGETVNDPYRMRINIKDDPTNEGFFIVELTWFNTSNGHFYVKYFESDNKIISSESYDDEGDLVRNYREYYLYDEVNAYCDLYHYQTSPTETLFYILHSTGDAPAGVYLYEEETVADVKQYIYYESSLNLSNSSTTDTGFPASFTNLISLWMTNAPSDITNYHPEDHLPEADSSHFADLAF